MTPSPISRKPRMRKPRSKPTNLNRLKKKLPTKPKQMVAEADSAAEEEPTTGVLETKAEPETKVRPSRSGGKWLAVA